MKVYLAARPVMGQTLTKEQAARLRFGGTLLAERPHLAALVMQVIGTWSHTDSILNSILAHLLKSEIEAATVMLQTIGSSVLRTDVIKSVAKLKLSRDDYELFDAALKTTRTSERLRDSFAHHLWGVAEALPEALILRNPKDENLTYAQIMELVNAGGVGKPGAHAVTHPPLPRMFDQESLLAALHDAARANNIVSKLALITGPHYRDELVESMRQSLYQDPLVARELQTRAQKKQQQNAAPS